MEILVVGAGSIGRRHINNLNLLGYRDIDVVDICASNLNYVKDNLRINKTFNNLGDGIKSREYDVAFILTPPAEHIPMALELAGRGIDLFIEKPLSHNLENVNKLVKIKEKKGLVLMVGYNQRFNFGLQKLKSYIDEGLLGGIYYIRVEVGQYLPDWRPWQEYQKSYTAIKELGGGIILDASHEIDYVMWLVNSEVKDIKAVYAKVSSLEMDVEDIAEAILRFENNVIVSIHLNMVERGYNRYCRVVGEKGGCKFTFKDNTLEFYDGASGELVTERYGVDANQPYIDELKHFFNCVDNRTEPFSNIYTAWDTLKVIMKIKEVGN